MIFSTIYYYIVISYHLSIKSLFFVVFSPIAARYNIALAMVQVIPYQTQTENALDFFSTRMDSIILAMVTNMLSKPFVQDDVKINIL